MKTKLIVMTLTLIASSNWSVLAGETSNPIDQLNPQNSNSQCTPDCCDDNCDQ